MVLEPRVNRKKKPPSKVTFQSNLFNLTQFWGKIKLRFAEIACIIRVPSVVYPTSSVKMLVIPVFSGAFSRSFSEIFLTRASHRFWEEFTPFLLRWIFRNFHDFCTNAIAIRSIGWDMENSSVPPELQYHNSRLGCCVICANLERFLIACPRTTRVIISSYSFEISFERLSKKINQIWRINEKYIHGQWKARFIAIHPRAACCAKLE